MDYETVAAMQVSPEFKSTGEPSYAFKAMDPGIVLGTIGAGSGGLFDSDPATIVAGAQTCGSCHADGRNGGIRGASGGGSMDGVTTS